MLQRALQRFAKPWYRRQALRVFRDEESLSANPGLWSSIQRALDVSEFFILLASPESARSRWVDQEVVYWCAHKPKQNLLIAVTGGDIVWDNRRRDFDWERTTALPPSLQGRFSEEPRFVDFSWVRTEQHISLSHTLFRDRVADLGAPLHHRPKEDLVGEEIRQHRRTLRLVRSTVALLTALALLTGVLAIRATRSANEARRSANEARRERDLAQTQLRLATARYLAARSVSDVPSQYARAVLLSLASLAITDTTEGRGSFQTNLQRNPRLRAFVQAPGQGRVPALAFSPDGRVMASGAANQQIAVWDARTDHRRCQLPRAKTKSQAWSGYLAISSKWVLAAATEDDRVMFVDLRDCRVLRGTQPNDNDTIDTMAFSPDGRTLASGGVFGKVTLWNVTKSRRERQLQVPGKDVAVRGVAFSPDGRTLAAAGGLTNVVSLWNYRSARPTRTELRGSKADLNTVAFSPDGKILAAGSTDQRVLLWDTHTHKLIGEPLFGEHQLVNSVAFSSDGRVLASAGSEGRILLWDPRTRRQLGQPLLGHEGSVDAVAFSPTGQRLASGSTDGTVVMWDLNAAGRLTKGLKVQKSSVTATTFSPDGKTLALANGSDRTLLLWSIRARRPIGKLLGGYRGFVTSLAFGPGGGILAAGTSSGSIDLWDMKTHRVVRRLLRHTGTVTEMAFGSDGRVLASSSEDGKVVLWDLKTGRVKWDQRPLERLGRESDDVRGVALSPDGRSVAAVAEYYILLWDVATGRQVHKPIDAGQKLLFDVTFSTDGRMLAVAGFQSMRLWEVATGRPVTAKLPSENHAFLTSTLTPDGKTIIGVHEGGSLTLWSAEGIPLGAPIASKHRSVESWAVSPDARTVAAGTSDGFLTIWDIDINSWRVHACSIVNRNLTKEEWSTAVGRDIPYIRTCPRVP